MRIWDIEPQKLCNKHLLGEHRELHALWTILVQSKKGYANHPETKRWRGKLKALFLRHEQLVKEMVRRGYKHKSPLDQNLALGSGIQDQFVDSIEKQKEILKRKNCPCLLDEKNS
ncbi:pyrimidine dimer DNA glycosylase/endonuclease V [Candidatus Methylacidiphilum infernorum]|uniref:Pyrimidine dimer DNA glycosylase n=1 Tax=Methylacidiphilum infernorum (isolate V4) TaxID=481448 RepID=B3DWN8_METI4|nr:pyrimidine dimer DNA glycosylase/endonuclease V [Candidatus Methylacidiphilum infernorum]ACD83701.1 Pyrimidine dimer DNA glycosylase [Methylacidiphilum infernorum V4]